MKVATILTRDDAGRPARVEYRAAALGRNVRYVLDYDYGKAPASFSWTLVEGDMLRALDGTYAFAAEGDGTLRHLRPVESTSRFRCPACSSAGRRR